MGGARPAGARWPRIAMYTLLTAAAAAAFLKPAIASGDGFALGLDRSSAPWPPAVAAQPAPPPERLGLGADPEVLAPTAPDAVSGAASDRGDATGGPRAMPSLSALPHRVWHDVGALAIRPLAFDSRDWTRFAVGVAAVGAMTAFDARIRDNVQSHATSSGRSFANSVRPLGTWGGVAAMGALLGAGELSGDASLASTGADGLEATLLSAGLIGPALKELAGRGRPSAGVGGFEPISKGQSFPSGEATEAFALAAVVSNHASSPLVRGIAWGLAGLVGWERIELNAHWASDVVAGALIGATVGNWVSRRSREDAGGGHALAVRPMVGPGVVGVSGSLSW